MPRFSPGFAAGRCSVPSLVGSGRASASFALDSAAFAAASVAAFAAASSASLRARRAASASCFARMSACWRAASACERLASASREAISCGVRMLGRGVRARLGGAASATGSDGAGSTSGSGSGSGWAGGAATTSGSGSGSGAGGSGFDYRLGNRSDLGLGQGLGQRDGRRFDDAGRRGLVLAADEDALLAHLDLDRAGLAARVRRADLGGLLARQRDLLLGVGRRAVLLAQVVEQARLVLLGQVVAEALAGDAGGRELLDERARGHPKFGRELFDRRLRHAASRNRAHRDGDALSRS